MAKKHLNKGLSAIFGNDIDSFLDDIENNGEITSRKNDVALSEIHANPYQPRKIFDQESLKELAASIKEHGVFQPILLRKGPSGYELIAGERRVRAAKMAGLQKIPAIIVDFTDQEMMEISLLENIQREDLSIIEEAQAYQQLIAKLDYTQEELAQRVGKSRTYITNTLRLLKLSPEIQKLLEAKALTYGHARALINIEDPDRQLSLAKRVIDEGLTVRDIERLSQGQKPKKAKSKDPYLEDLKHRLESKFQTKVEVNKKAMIIRYRNDEDLNRILEIMDCLEEAYVEE